MSKKMSLASAIVSELSSELGLTLTLEPEFGYAGKIVTQSGKISYFHSSTFDINGQGASAVAKDKAYASFFMKSCGYPTPQEGVFFSDLWAQVVFSPNTKETATAFANKIGYPVMVKPNSDMQGHGVEKVYTDLDLANAMNFIFDEIKDRVALVQTVVPGEDYRIVVLGTEVLCAYRRTPLAVTGDGMHTIQQLLADKQQLFLSRGRNTTINPTDPRITRYLQHQNLTVSSIVATGQTVQLLTNANLSSGGESEDVTEQLHQDYKTMAVKLAHDMGLTFAGVDIMTTHPISSPITDYCVIEINAAPGLDYYGESGPKQREIVKNLYKKLLCFVPEDMP